jgi:hypothetical protein
MAERAEASAVPAEEPHEKPATFDDMARKVMRALRWVLPLGSIAGAITLAELYDAGAGILLLAGGVLLGIIAILWASIRTLSGETPITLEEAVELGGPSATEEQKRAVLQALKDLDYERSVGKVSDADYEELLRRYRADAKRLLRAVDEDLAPRRARAQAYVDQYLGGANAAEPTPSKTAGQRCTACQTDNDTDARFCKKCGAGLPSASKDRQDATA